MTERSTRASLTTAAGATAQTKSPARKSPASTRQSAEVPRRVSSGDTTGSSQPRTIRKNTVNQMVSARQASQLAAVLSLIHI